MWLCLRASHDQNNYDQSVIAFEYLHAEDGSLNVNEITFTNASHFTQIAFYTHLVLILTFMDYTTTTRNPPNRLKMDYYFY
jgi:hypothetical protein